MAGLNLGPSSPDLFPDRKSPAGSHAGSGRGGPWRGRLLAALVAGGLLLTALEGMGWWVARRGGEDEEAGGQKVKPLATLQAENAALRKKLAALGPRGVYVVVDTAGNRVYLRQGEKTLKEMIASCGSGNILVDPAGGRTWVFDTPRGAFRIHSKVRNPLWIKPDWAFIEEGQPIPDNNAERAESGMMGEYALGIGRGYFIHGTLYTRLLGRNVSHGCIRLGDQDLKELVGRVSIGTSVIIY